MKNKLLKNWGATRIIRLVAGLGLIIFGLLSKGYIIAFLGTFFMFQALLNLSCCCGIDSCNSGTDKTKSNLYEDQIEQYKADKK